MHLNYKETKKIHSSIQFYFSYGKSNNDKKRTKKIDCQSGN